MRELPFGHPAWIEIDLIQFQKNIHAIRHLIGTSKLCLPVKANAYGHGLITTSEAAVAAGVDYLAVSCLQEGALLRKAGIKIPILVLGAIHEAQIPELLAYNLEFSISSYYKAQLVANVCKKLQKKCRIHLEIDTGMMRTGVRLHTATELFNYLTSENCFEIVGVYSHLATGDIPNDPIAKEQINHFRSFITDHVKKYDESIICHIANSGGVCYYPESHLDMVRPGILAFGYFPYDKLSNDNGIKPFFSVKAKIAYFKLVPAGAGISYGHTYHTSEHSHIVTIPIGYGDGYRRSLSNRSKVIIRGKLYPAVGTICMDQFMVNVGRDEAHVGDEVIIIGKDNEAEISLNEIAKLCDTIPYEILCGFNDRLPRFYIK